MTTGPTATAADNQRDLALMENLFSSSDADTQTIEAAPSPTPLGSSPDRPRRPQLRRLSALVGDAIKRISAHSQSVLLHLGGIKIALRTTSGVFPMPEVDVFHLRFGQHVFQLEVEQLFELLQVPAQWWNEIPGSLRADLLADLMGSFSADVSTKQRLQVTYVGVSGRLGPAELPCELAFALKRDGERTEYRARLKFQTAADVAQLSSFWEQLPATGILRLPNFSLPASIEIFSTNLNVSDLRRLRPGALVPLGAPLEGRDALVSIGWGKRFVAPAVVNQKIVKLQGGVRPMDESKAGGLGVAFSELSKMENLEVQFTVELATCSLPLAELSRLGPGSTLNLGLPHEPPLVRLCVNGKAVATGELVVLGQSLGVQIVDMASA